MKFLIGIIVVFGALSVTPKSKAGYPDCWMFKLMNGDCAFISTRTCKVKFYKGDWISNSCKNGVYQYSINATYDEVIEIYANPHLHEK